MCGLAGLALAAARAQNRPISGTQRRSPGRAAAGLGMVGRPPGNQRTPQPAGRTGVRPIWAAVVIRSRGSRGLHGQTMSGSHLAGATTATCVRCRRGLLSRSSPNLIRLPTIPDGAPTRGGDRTAAAACARLLSIRALSVRLVAGHSSEVIECIAVSVASPPHRARRTVASCAELPQTGQTEIVSRGPTLNASARRTIHHRSAGYRRAGRPAP